MARAPGHVGAFSPLPQGCCPSTLGVRTQRNSDVLLKMRKLRLSHFTVPRIGEGVGNGCFPGLQGVGGGLGVDPAVPDGFSEYGSSSRREKCK